MVNTTKSIRLCRSRERSVFQIVGSDESQHGIAEQIGVFTIIKSPRHLVQIGLQMLCANPMPRTNDAALQQRERGFYRVSVNVGSDTDIFLLGMIHRLMLFTWYSGALHCMRICGEVIRHDHIHVTADVLADVLGQCSRLGVCGMEEPQIAAALTDTDHNLFCLFASVNAPSDLFAAYVGLIYFNGAIQFGSGDLFNSMTDAMTEIPSSAIVDSQHSLQLICADTLAGLAHYESSKKPFCQRQVRIVEDRASSNGELITA